MEGSCVRVFKQETQRATMKNTKQVIVMRKDLKMRTGKACAQASHASMAFLTARMRKERLADTHEYWYCTDTIWDTVHADEIDHWLKNCFRKIVCYVDSEEELLAVHTAAKAASLTSHLITDNGTTEFGGAPTKTCIAIGPHYDDRFHGITTLLPLL